MSLFGTKAIHPISKNIPQFADAPFHALVTGGTGFIGKPLVQNLLSQGHKVTVISRRAAHFDEQENLHYVKRLGDVDHSEHFRLIINLAGEPLVGKRWNAKSKQEFYDSRIGTTKAIVQLCERQEIKPDLVISGSAVGYYGAHGDEVLNEDSSFNDGFAHQLCNEWENAARPVEALGIRLACLRTGIVLGHGGGSLAEMRKSFDMGVSSQLGHGRQYLPWIHLDDLLGIMAWISANATLTGPFNGTAPNPVTHTEFAAAMRKRKKTMFHMSVPAFALRLMMGEAADELLLTGQRVVPDNIQKAGYEFLFPTIDEALADLV